MNVLKSLLVLSLVFCGTAIAKNTLESYGVGTIEDGTLHVSAAEAAAILAAHEDIIVLDVRTPKEHAEGKVKAGINVDYYANDFKEQLSALDKDQPYLVHCRTGGRSGRTLPIMQALGFKHVIHLDGGIRAWRALSE